jgi:glycosyltransferase involved in cell wall biosynthesis
MKILHLIKTTEGATWALRQIKVLLDLGCQVDVVLPDINHHANDYIAAGARVHVLNVDVVQVKNPIRFLKSVFSFRQLIKQTNPDLIHSHFVGTTLFMRFALFLSKIPKIFQVAGPLHLEKTLTRQLDIRSASSHDYWIATCHRTRQYYLESGIQPSKVGFSFYGTDLNQIKSYPTGKLRTELGLFLDQKIVGMVAFCYPPKKWLGQERGLKGHEDLIDAMVKVIEQRPEVVCVIIGGAWGKSEEYYESVKKYGKDRLGDQVVFLGTRRDVPQLYPDFDMVVHPSHSENLGGAAESLILGIPTIASNTGGFPDIVVDGKTGLLFEPKNIDMLAQKINQMLDDPIEAKKMAENGHELVIKALDVNQTAKHVFDFYQHVLSEEKNETPR